MHNNTSAKKNFSNLCAFLQIILFMLDFELIKPTSWKPAYKLDGFYELYMLD
jgi:hypothetical protein